ncbi:MAG: T9SS type A sorting domain-containing protein [Flavobacteriales bacterium]|jgi:hypothetical protein
MKTKLFYLTILFYLNSFSQQLSNNSFDGWINVAYGSEPQFWGYLYQGNFVYGTNNSIAGYNEGDPLTTTFISGAQAYGGSGKSILLETKAAVGQTMIGSGFTTIPGELYRKEPVSGDIGSITFKYKSLIVAGDSCFVSARTFDVNNNVCSQGVIWLKPNNNSASWQTLTLILNNVSGQLPTQIEIDAMSTYDNQYTYQTTTLGSKLYLDNFTLNYCNNPTTTNANLTICDDALPYVWNGITFNGSGNQSATLNSITGCDSIVNLTLTVIPGPYTLIPDLGFETKLGQLGLDPCGIDGKVPTSLIQNLVTLNLTGSFSPAINDLTGIQDFTALENLNVDRSVFSTGNGVYITNPNGVNLSQNINLKNFKCTGCNLQQLDLSANALLETLDLGSWTSPPTLPMNNITSLNLSSNINLTGLRANYCGIQNISLPQSNSNLTTVTLDHNNISSIDLASATNLNRVDLSFNNLTIINAQNNSQLSMINLNNNANLISLPGSIEFVDTLMINHCGFSGLNLSNCGNLKYFDCSNNNLGCLNIKNNSNNQIAYINTVNNFTLTCIEVDDSVYSSNNPVWTANKDPWSSYSEDCPGVGCITTELNQATLTQFLIYPNPAQNEINIIGEVFIDNSYLTALDGKRVYLENSGNKILIPNLSNGIYTLCIETNNGETLVKKITIYK